MAVDTLTIAKDLKAAELPPEQAEAIAAAIGRSISEVSATKGDLLLVKQELKADIAQLAAATKADIAQLDAKIEALQGKLVMWFVGTQIAFVAIIGAILKLQGSGHAHPS